MSFPSLKEAHFMYNNYQTNVYGTIEIVLPNSNKLLFATSHGVHALEFQRTEDAWRPLTRRIQFTYIPADAEIVSIDAFNRRQYGEGLVIGVCFIKDADSPKPSQFLNIYTATEPGGEFDLDHIANGCRDHALPYFPYQLYHADLVVDGIHEVAFLLSGSDQQIHLFREDRLMMSLGYSEQPVEIYFPEFSHFKSNVLWMDISHDEICHRRTSVTGTQNGSVCIAHVDTVKREIVRSWSVSHDSPITSVRLFTRSTNRAADTFCQRRWQPLYESDDDSSKFPSRVLNLFDEEAERKPIDEELQLLVTSALEPAKLYADIKTNGFNKGLELPDSNLYDCVLGSVVADIDMDGQNEVAICTYGQTLLIYKPKFSSACGFTDIEEANLIYKIMYAYPLLGLRSLDITRDGVMELVLVSVKGLHILQHDPEEVVRVLLEKLRRLKCVRTQ